MNVRKSLYSTRMSRMSRMSRSPRSSSVSASAHINWTSESTLMASKMFLDNDDSERSDGTRHAAAKKVSANKMHFYNYKTTKFFTGSKYNGSWNQFGFNGFGTYTFPNGVEYDGQFSNGAFHGNGTLTYPNGTVITGHWKHGMSSDLQLQFADGLVFHEHSWSYCTPGKDRRFAKDEYRDLLPVGASIRLPQRVNFKIPAGCYNVFDGYYNPRTKCVYSLTEPERILRIPTSAEEKWIMENCPTAWEEMSAISVNGIHNCCHNIDYTKAAEEF